MLKVLHTGDWHIGSFPGPEVDGQNARFQDICRCLDFQAMYAEEHRPDLIVVSGDIFHQARVWSDRGLRESRTAIDHIRRLSNVAPTVVLRGTPNHDSRSISLNDYMKQLIKAHNADIDTEGTPEEFDMTLYEHLFDGPETIEGLLAEHYTLSWALASLRDKLKHYEDALIPEIMPEGLQTIDRAIGTYGKDAQLTKAVEEMSELTKALCKLKECKRKYDTPFNRETQEVYSNVEEETADVFIMLVQLFAIFNPHELVNITKIVWDKLDRLKDNLDKEAAKQEASDAGKK